jgi:hypothetical protein
MCQLLWALDCLADIRDHSVAPAAHLVAEDPEAPCKAASDRAFCNNAPATSVVVANRCLLDHEPP